MPGPVVTDISLRGPIFDRAVALAREAVSSVIHRDTAGVAALEFVLSEAANDRLVGLTLTLVLANIAGDLASMLAELDLSGDYRDGAPPADAVREQALMVVTEILSGLSFGSDPSRSAGT
jgi:hypothetical protein